PAPRAFPSRRTASPRSREAPTCTVYSPTSRGGGVSGAMAAGGIWRARGGGGTTVAARGVEATTVRTDSGFCAPWGRSAAGTPAGIAAVCGAEAGAFAGRSAWCARASSAARSSARSGDPCIDAALRPIITPSEKTVPSRSNAQTASAIARRPSTEPSTFSRSLCTSRGCTRRDPVAATSSVFLRRSIHALGRGYAEHRQGVGQRLLHRPDEIEPRGGLALVPRDHPLGLLVLRIVAVELRDGFLEIEDHLVRLERRGGVRDQLGKLQDALDQVDLFRKLQRAHRLRIPARFDALLLARPAQDRRAAGVAVLDVEDGIAVVALLRESQVEVQRHVRAAQEE